MAPSSAPTLAPERLASAYTYASYRQLIDQLLAEDKTTGPEQSEQLTHYARLNVQRMHRLDKTIQLQPELVAAVQALPRPYLWLTLTEGWCGDAAQLVPVFEAVAQASAGRIDTRYLLRDENLDLMDRYLTGSSRAIPRLLVLDAATLREVATWGPRPAPAQELLTRLKAEGLPHDEFIAQIHLWYAHDKTQAAQHELLALVQGPMSAPVA